MVVFSTGNVYPLVPATGPAPTEQIRRRRSASTRNPASGRERVVEFVSREDGLRALMFRLNYAVDLRYGTLVDIARKVFAGEPIDLTVGYFNAIWQGDANSYALRSLELCDRRRPCSTSPARAHLVREMRGVVRPAFGKRPAIRERGRAGRAAQRLEPLPHAARRAAGAACRCCASGSRTGSATAAAR